MLKLVYQELTPFNFELPGNSNIYINGGHLLQGLYYAIISAYHYTQPQFLMEDSTSIKFVPIRFLTRLPQRALNKRPVQFAKKLPLYLLFNMGNLLVLGALKKLLVVLVKIEKAERVTVCLSRSVRPPFALLPLPGGLCNYPLCRI